MIAGVFAVFALLAGVDGGVIPPHQEPTTQE